MDDTAPVESPQPTPAELATAYFAAAGLCGFPQLKATLPGSLRPNYDGTFDLQAGPAQDGAQSRYEGLIVATALDRALVEAVLPPGLELAGPPLPPPIVPPGQHPVVILLGLQGDPMGLENGKEVTIPLAKPYKELILLIPFCVGQGGTGLWHSYSARMYLEDLAAIGIGNVVFAYSKEMGEFDGFGDLEQVSHLGNTVFEVDSRLAGAWLPEPDACNKLAGFTDVEALLKMPIIGFDPLFGYVRSYFEWDYAAFGAEVAPITAQFRFCGEFRPGMQPWVALGWIAGATDAAFRLRNVRWRLSTTACKLRF